MLHFFSRRAREKCLAVYCFLVRLYFYSDAKMREVEDKLDSMGRSLLQLHKEFYKNFQKGFCDGGKMQATPNVHTFWHLLESRRRSGPLWSTSAEPFESLYSVLQRCYKAGTKNTPKQVIENFYLSNT